MPQPVRGRGARAVAGPRFRRGRVAVRADPRRGDRPERRLCPAGRPRGHLRQRRAGHADDRRAPAVPERGEPAPAADRRGGGLARKAHRARRPGGEGADDQLEPAAGGLARKEVPGQPALAPGPDPGGHPGADPRGREVRLAAWLQVLDLRDLVDPAGDRAGHRQQGARDPRARARAAARAQARPGRARDGDRAGSRADRRGAREAGRDPARAAAGRAGGGARR